jgi:hypothetical protein
LQPLEVPMDIAHGQVPPRMLAASAETVPLQSSSAGGAMAG